MHFLKPPKFESPSEGRSTNKNYPWRRLTGYSQYKLKSRAFQLAFAIFINTLGTFEPQVPTLKITNKNRGKLEDRLFH